jgi:GGDEF domain-containing protein
MGVRGERDEREEHAERDELGGRDGLTGLLGEAAWLVAVARVPGPTLVASFDVCGLRAVNADVGHDAGDGVLRAVAERLEGPCRPARWPAATVTCSCGRARWAR